MEFVHYYTNVLRLAAAMKRLNVLVIWTPDITGKKR